MNKKKEIIKETKIRNKNDFHENICDFIIKSVDVLKATSDKFMNELKVILEQIKINFKEMVKERVGKTKDVQNFMKKENSSYYSENNNKNNKYIVNGKEIKNNNKIKKEEINYICNKAEKKSPKNELLSNEVKERKENLFDDFNQYNSFKINKYDPEYEDIYLDISNTFRANNNNNNNNYLERNEVNIIKNNTFVEKKFHNYYSDPKKIDIIKNLNNIKDSTEKKV